MIREHCDDFEVMVPYCAHSAGTLICLGADKIVMGKMGELSPVDPTTANPFNPIDENNKPNKIPISVEDVTAYLDLSKDGYGINGEDNKLKVFLRLADVIHPLALGNVYRKIQLIRMLAAKLIKLQKDNIRPEPEKLNRIIENLTAKLYTHDYFIGRDEAKDLELNVIEPSEEIETAMWELFTLYEDETNMKEPFLPEKIFDDNIGKRKKFVLPDSFQIKTPNELQGNPPQVVNNIVKQIADQIIPNVQDASPIIESFPSAYIESTNLSHIHFVNAKITGSVDQAGKRKVNLNISFEWKSELNEKKVDE
ncbi:MAG: hypothetical protein ACFFDN_51320 [Candidatus Hodarchaeota archaeon]